MKKILLKIVFISIIMIFAISLKSLANSSFRFYCGENVSVNPGETVEVPIYIDSIHIESVEKTLVTFSGTFDYDESAFELVPYTEDENIVYFKPDANLSDYGLEVKFNKHTKKIEAYLDYNHHVASKVYSRDPDSSYTYRGEYVNQFITLGTIKLKAKENVETGYYKCTISNIEANNGEFTIISGSDNSSLFIKGEEESDSADIDETADKGGSEKIVNNSNKKAILKIEVSEDGKKITITPDEVNGAKVQTIKYKNIELKRENDKFIFDSEPNRVYEFFAYAPNGTCYGNEYVTTTIESSKEDENKEDNKKEEDKKEDEPKDENSNGDKDKNNEQNNNEKEDNNKKNNSNEKKSPQTGDIIYIIIAILVICIYGFVVVYTIKKSKI